MPRIGIDFGTTNSSVAYYDGKRLHPIELDAANENPHVLPSLIYMDRNYHAVLGMQAANEYLARETGRRIVWERKEIHPIEIIVGGAGSGPIRYWHDLYIDTDVGANGRLLQSVKTALRDPRYEGTDIFERYFTIDELIAIILRSMKARAEAQLGETCDSGVLGRPVRFSDDPNVTQRAEESLYKSALYAGFRDVSFQMEPIGAAHLYHITAAKREIALIFDFGGGTLDLTIAEVGGKQPPSVIATRGVLVGGDDLDRRVMLSLLKYFGKGGRVDGGMDFPPDYLDLLHAWQTMPELSRPMPLERIRKFQ
ncbi:MAG TPA: Hsp70 family protein, partial [Anaerolineales bacterium]|nr:Hsp70 family protein [Anaerolineales bacterium]